MYLILKIRKLFYICMISHIYDSRSAVSAGICCLLYIYIKTTIIYITCICYIYMLSYIYNFLIFNIKCIFTYLINLMKI